LINGDPKRLESKYSIREIMVLSLEILRGSETSQWSPSCLPGNTVNTEKYRARDRQENGNV
jgi:hypothetical protein